MHVCLILSFLFKFSICIPFWPLSMQLKRTLNSWFSCLHLQSSGVTNKNKHVWFYAILGIEPRTSCMLGKYSTSWATTPALCPWYWETPVCFPAGTKDYMKMLETTAWGRYLERSLYKRTAWWSCRWVREILERDTNIPQYTQWQWLPMRRSQRGMHSVLRAVSSANLLLGIPDGPGAQSSEEVLMERPCSVFVPRLLP